MKDFFPYCKGNQFNSLITFEFSSSAWTSQWKRIQNSNITVCQRQCNWLP
jgi:hypothetical protein